MRTKVAPIVLFFTDGPHGAELRIEGEEAEDAPYSFVVEVVASFTFDLELALQTYRCKPIALPDIIAANIARVLYSGARESLAGATARAPHGAAMIESLFIEPTDVDIRFSSPAPEMLQRIFGVDDQTIEAIEPEIRGQSKEETGKASMSNAKSISKRAKKTKE